MEKKDVFVSTIKGFITGILSLIPGLTIASVVMSMSSYGNVIEGLSELPKKKNKALSYITIPIFIGILLGFVAGFTWVNDAWTKFQLQIVLLLVGLFFGGICVINRKEKIKLSKKSIIIPIVIIIASIILIHILKDVKFSIDNGILKAILLGLITSISIIIPSVSVFSMHLKGGYDILIQSIKHLTTFNNALVVILFALTFIITLLGLAKLIKKCIYKNKNIAYITLCSLVFVNIIILVIQIRNIELNFTTIFTALLAFLWGFIFAKNVERE